MGEVILSEVTEHALVDSTMLPSFLGQSLVTAGPLRGMTLSRIGTIDTPDNGGGIQLLADDMKTLLEDLAAARAALAGLKDAGLDDSVTGRSLKAIIEKLAKKIDEILKKKY
jgi:hypothetical protein